MENLTANKKLAEIISTEFIACGLCWDFEISWIKIVMIKYYLHIICFFFITMMIKYYVIVK